MLNNCSLVFWSLWEYQFLGPQRTTLFHFQQDTEDLLIKFITIRISWVFLVASNKTASQDALKLTRNLLVHITQTPGVGLESGEAQPGGSETNIWNLKCVLLLILVTQSITQKHKEMRKNNLLAHRKFLTINNLPVVCSTGGSWVWKDLHSEEVNKMIMD